eukprot:6176661-Pleurochrysis_carterae.AAC.2
MIVCDARATAQLTCPGRMVQLIGHGNNRIAVGKQEERIECQLLLARWLKVEQSKFAQSPVGCSLACTVDESLDAILFVYPLGHCQEAHPLDALGLGDQPGDDNVCGCREERSNKSSGGAEDSLAQERVRVEVNVGTLDDDDFEPFKHGDLNGTEGHVTQDG